MLTHPHSAPRRGWPYLCLLLTLLLAGALFLPAPTLPHPLAMENVLRATPDPADRIDFTPAQLAEIEAAYTDGFRNPNPDDPCARIKMLPYKQLSKWTKQLSRRGFTLETIKELLKTGRRVPHTHPVKGTTYTRIIGPSGKCIIVDFADCILWQVAPANFKF